MPTYGAPLVRFVRGGIVASLRAPQYLTVSLPADRLEGRRLVDLLPADDAAVLARNLMSRRQGEQDLQLRMQHSGGRMLVLEGTVTDLSMDPAVQGWVLNARDITERHTLVEQLAHQSFHDALTGLANRQLFADRLAHALSRQAARPEPLTVLLCDLDDFKHVNDSRGHGTGDQILVEAGKRILRALRPGDTAARLGGDEFAVLVEGGDVAEATVVAGRVQHLLAEPFYVDGTPVVWAARLLGAQVPERVLHPSDAAGVAVRGGLEDDQARDRGLDDIHGDRLWAGSEHSAFGGSSIPRTSSDATCWRGPCQSAT